MNVIQTDAPQAVTTGIAGIARINGVPLNREGEQIGVEDLRQRAFTELLRQAGSTPTIPRPRTASSARRRPRPSMPGWRLSWRFPIRPTKPAVATTPRMPRAIARVSVCR
jgi:hypothetical protein